MEENNSGHLHSTDDDPRNLHSNNYEAIEPARKKRCIRFSSEDPSIVSDSGFGDLSSCHTLCEENGDLEVSSFFGNDLSSLVDPEHEFETIKDVDDADVEDRNPDSGLTNSSSIFSDPSDPGCSSTLLSPNSSTSSSNIEPSNTSGEVSSVDEKLGDIILQNKEVAGSPTRTHLMQRFLTQLQKNPNDAQLQHFFQLLLAGPEFAPPRQRLRHVTHLTDVIRLLRCSKKILVLTGAGISVSCGIPDFRSKDGLYSRVSKVFPNLPDPQSVFDIRLFRRDPRPFFLTAKELYPGQFEPSLSHKFIQKLESRGQLLRNYSQNIDTLENIAGIKQVTMCHGSFATATCIRCKYRVDAEAIKEKVLLGEVPFCPSCSTTDEVSRISFPIATPPQSPSFAQTRSEHRPVFDQDEEESYSPLPGILRLPPVLKPDIVFFGEDLPDEFHDNLDLDKPECDLLLVIGSSLRVRPVSSIPAMLPPEVPQILINRESLSHCRFDIELLGNCDEIIAHLCRNLGPGFNEFASSVELQEIDKLPKLDGSEPNVSVDEPKSENDIQALKACWEPKGNDNISERLPENSYLSWNPRQYVFQGAEIMLDEDEDDDENEDEDSSESDSDDESVSSSEIRENETDVTTTLKSNTRIIPHTDVSPTGLDSAEDGVKTETKKGENVQIQSEDKSN